MILRDNFKILPFFWGEKFESWHVTPVVGGESDEDLAEVDEGDEEHERRQQQKKHLLVAAEFAQVGQHVVKVDGFHRIRRRRRRRRGLLGPDGGGRLLLCGHLRRG